MQQQNKDKAAVQLPANMVTNLSISRLNEEYANKISAGQISVTASREKRKLSPGEKYDLKMKEHKIGQAVKEKQELEKRLQYLDRSIQSIKAYDYSTGQVSPSESPREGSPADPQQLVNHNRRVIHRLKQERLKLEEKKKQEQIRQQSKLKLEEQVQAKRLSEQKARRKEQIFQKMKKIKSRMESREQELRKQEEEYHRVLKETPLFSKLEKEFSQQQNNLLEERKKKLANIRNLHKPVTLLELEEHERKFLEALQDKQSIRERERRLTNAVQQYKVSYKSPHHHIYSQEHSRLDQQDNESKLKADKMKQFSEHVRENFVPQVDDRKRGELQKKIEEEAEKQQKRGAKEDEDRYKVEEIRKKGLRYLQEMRDLPKRRESHSQVGPVTERPRYKNYLTHSDHDGKTKWGSILQSKGSKKEKAMRLQLQAQKLESSLKLKEQKARVLKKDEEEVDEEYYEMIKAKLELLQI